MSRVPGLSQAASECSQLKRPGLTCDPFLRPEAPPRPSVSLLRGPRPAHGGKSLPWPRPSPGPRTAVTDLQPPVPGCPPRAALCSATLSREAGCPPMGGACGQRCGGPWVWETGLQPACPLPPSGPMGCDPGQNPPSWVGAPDGSVPWWPCRDGLRLGPPEGSGCCRVGGRQVTGLRSAPTEPSRPNIEGLYCLQWSGTKYKREKAPAPGPQPLWRGGGGGWRRSTRRLRPQTRRSWNTALSREGRPVAETGRERGCVRLESP